MNNQLKALRDALLILEKTPVLALETDEDVLSNLEERVALKRAINDLKIIIRHLETVNGDLQREETRC